MLLFVISCKKDGRDELPGLTISELKKNYEKQIMGYKASMFAEYNPAWDKSYTTTKDGYNVTEVPFTNSNKVVPLLINEKLSDVEMSHAAASAQVKLILLNRAGTTDVTIAYMMLRSKESINTSNFHYKDFGQFSGKVDYFNIDGSYQNGYLFQSGKIDKIISKSVLTAQQVLNLKERKTPIGNGPRDKVMLYDSNSNCDVTVYDYYYETCVYIEGHPEYGTYCSYQFAYSVPVITCYGSGGGGGGSGGGGDGGYSGGGGGSGGTPPVPAAPDPDPYNICDRTAKVNSSVSNANFAAKNKEVNNATLATGNEYGYEQRLASLSGTTYKDIPVRTDGTTGQFTSYFTWSSTSGYTIGDVHSHPLGYNPSPADVFGMAKNLNSTDLQAAGSSDIDFYKKNVSITVITANYIYVVTVKDWTALNAAYTTYKNDPSAYTLSYQTLSTQSGGQEKALLSLLGNAVNYYKVAKGTSTAVPYVIGSDGTVVPLNCPGAAIE